MPRSCKATNANGSACSAQPIRTDGYCYWHSPATATERQENRRKGGYARSNAARARKRLPDDVLDIAGIQAVTGQTIKAVLAGAIDPGPANAIASLLRVALAANEAQRLDEIDSRLRNLEREGIA